MKDNKRKEGLDKFLDKPDDCTTEECKIRKKDELVEKVDKKFIVEDGRELLREITHKRH